MSESVAATVSTVEFDVAASVLLHQFLGQADSLRYEGISVSPRHLPPVKYSDEYVYMMRSNARHDYVQWFEPGKSFMWEPLDYLLYFMARTISYAPVQVENVFSVDDGGGTTVARRPYQATAWCPTVTGVSLRLSEVRTAMHSFGMLRSEIDGSGLALEATRRPDSIDPSDAFTLFVFQPKRDYNANYPHAQQKPASVFDLCAYGPRPYFVGPLYDGYPHEVTAPETLACIHSVTKRVIRHALNI